MRLDRIANGPKYSGRADDIRDALVDLLRALPESRMDFLRPWLPLAWALTMLVAWAQISVTWLR